VLKKIRYAFNENADQFSELKKIGFEKFRFVLCVKKRIFDSRFLRLKRKIITTKI